MLHSRHGAGGFVFGGVVGFFEDGVGGRGWGFFPGVEIGDDEHDPIHADPVAGERADVVVCTGRGGGGEVEGFGFAGLDHGEGLKDFWALRDVGGFGVGVVRAEALVPAAMTISCMACRAQ